MKFNESKFSLAQMTSDNNGKTSGAGTMGIYIVIMSIITFCYGAWEFHTSGKNDIMMYSSANILVGAGLLGYHKSVEGKRQDSASNEIVQDIQNDLPK